MIGRFPIGRRPIAKEQAVAASNTITGTLSVTLGAVTLSAQGNLPIAASASITLGNVTLASAGNLPLNATAAATLGSVTLAATGQLPITAGLAVTLGAISVSSAGNLPIAATDSTTLGAITLSAQGNLPIAASFGKTLGAVTLSATGQLPITAGFAATLGAVTLAATGGGPGIAGTAAITLDAITLAATATIATAVQSGGVGGIGLETVAPVHRQGDTRWDGMAQAREEARRLFDDLEQAPPAQRKAVVEKASEAVATVARKIRPVSERGIPVSDGFAMLLDDLSGLQAILAGMMAQEQRIRDAEARAAAEQWAMIEREMRAAAQREEELLIVMAMAL